MANLFSIPLTPQLSLTRCFSCTSHISCLRWYHPGFGHGFVLPVSLQQALATSPTSSLAPCRPLLPAGRTIFKTQVKARHASAQNLPVIPHFEWKPKLCPPPTGPAEAPVSPIASITFYLLLFLFQPHLTPCCSWKMPTTLLPQGHCTCCTPSLPFPLGFC